MARTTGRVFLLLVAVAVPPLIAFAAVGVLAADQIERLGMGTALLGAVGFTVVWAAVAAIAASRTLGVEARRMIEVAERGSSDGIEDEGKCPHGVVGAYLIDLRPGRPCPPDLNEDGSVTSTDFFDFLAAFFEGCE